MWVKKFEFYCYYFIIILVKWYYQLDIANLNVTQIYQK